MIKSKQIQNISNYLTDTISKIDGFDYRWYSLITSEPLLFEDIDYFRCRGYINNTVTEQELIAYREGKLTQLYYTFESLLMLNLKYFDRIISLCTIAFMQYVRIGNKTTSEHLNKVPMFLSLTPTQIWCMALCGTNSTEWELNYAWSVSKKKPIIIEYPTKEEQSIFEVNFTNIYKKNALFKRFIEYAAYRNNTEGFLKTKIADTTSIRKLTDICSKFTRTTMVFDESKLNGIIKLIDEYKQVEKELHTSLDKNLQSMYVNKNEYAIFVFQNEFYIHSKKFKMVISKRERPDKTTYIQKEYISNSYECFVAESKMSPSIKQQIAWAKRKLSNSFDIDKQQLIHILLNMLKSDYKQIVCILNTPTPNVFSKVIFTGVFNNIYIHEYMYAGITLVHETKKCMSKENAARYLVERGYYLFGTNDDVQMVLSGKISLIDHYTKYCIPILTHMKDIQQLHYDNNQKIIDVLIERTLPSSELVVVDTYTTLKGSRRSIKSLMPQQENSQNKLSYWQAVNS